LESNLRFGARLEKDRLVEQHRLVTLQVAAAVLWGVVGAGVALYALSDVNADVRILVGVLSVLLPGASIAAAVAIHRNQPTLAVVFLLISTATPTYFAWGLNLIPLLIVASITLSRSRARTVIR
jgi:hypothetical protein